MKNFKQLLAAALILMLAMNAYTQGVGINNDESDADPSAMLDVKSTEKGILVPRMISSQRTAIATPANGLLVYDITTQSFWFYQNSAWRELNGDVAVELSDGDGDTKITSGIGDDDVLRFYSGDATNEKFRIVGNTFEPRNNNSSIFIGEGVGYSNTIGGANTIIGYNSFSNNTEGVNNTGVGVNTLLMNVTGKFNSAYGFMSLFQNSVGQDNTAIGISSLCGNTIGSYNTAIGGYSLENNTVGSYNTALGLVSLYKNISGTRNTSVGVNSLKENISGKDNVAFGFGALTHNTSGNSNVAIGINALFNNTTQSNLVAIGDSALYHNGIGAGFGEAEANSAIGSKALYSNTEGGYNVASGNKALYSNTTGSLNTANGVQALHYNTIGSFNTAIGYNAKQYGTDQYNTTSLGHGAGNYYNLTNYIEIGNTSVVWIGGEVTWHTYSDKRIKKNINENVVGLDFINKLRPVTYNLDVHAQNKLIRRDRDEKEEGEWPEKYNIEKKKMTGFIAQEVEQAAQEVGYEFSGVSKAKDDLGMYSVSYSQFVVPLVKAVQELAEENRKLKKRLEKLENN